MALQFINLPSLPLSALALAIGLTLPEALLMAQDQPQTDVDATVTYPVSYFDQYAPFSVSDMLDRIPGINVARQNGAGSGGSGSSSGSERRGLGLGGDQVLINGRRIAGKGNEGNAQLSRIPANQVQYIEIIRGTSGDLDVRGGNQVINVVLLEAESRSSVAVEINSDRYHDGRISPGGKVSLTGQRGAFDYLLSAETEPRWEFRDGFERSIHPDGSANDTIKRVTTTDSQPVILTTNLGYQFGDNDVAHFNAQYEDTDAPSKTARTITDFNQFSPLVSREFDIIPSSNDFWEIGGDFEHRFANSSRFKTLFIVNRREDDSSRETFIDSDDGLIKNLFLDNFNRNQERIARASYSFSLSSAQDLELGIERAQTILDSSLQLGELSLGSATSPDFGGLTAVTDANATVEEIRYETFLVHNWQLNPRMSMESTLIYEISEINQSGDINKTRDFSFVRPKLDYRFDVTPSLQLRATIEKDVGQLSFNDFTANINGADDDQNAVAGNPDLRQEQSWRYDLNLEYRLPNDAGVLNGNVFYHDLEDVIDKVDVSTVDSLLSANGNIGDGERYGIRIDASLRLGFLDLPQMLVTSRLELEDSKVTDPFLGIERRLSRNGRGNYQLGLRHDLPQWNSSYGFDFRRTLNGNNKVYDIDRIEDYQTGDFLSFFAETVGWGGLTYRFEAMNALESERCRIRTRYDGGSIATGLADEIEDSCSHTGIKYAIKIRGSF